MNILRPYTYRGGPFILANAWDVGSAKMLAALGAKALATTSSGHAFTLGKTDMGHVSRDVALQHANDLVVATNLPVSADLENGYGEAPEIVAETTRLAIEADWPDFVLKTRRCRTAVLILLNFP